MITGNFAQHTESGIAHDAIPHFGPKPSFDNVIGHKHLPRASQKNGLRFQAAVEKECIDPKTLLARSGSFSYDEVMCGPWIYYKDSDDHARFSQPDVLLFNHECKQLVIIECKLRHTRYAWGQYKHYQALLRMMYPFYQICGIEVCKSIDPLESYAALVTDLKPHTLDFTCYLWLS